MNPLRLPARPAVLCQEHLAAHVPDRWDGPALVFAPALPKGWTPADAPHVCVFDDGGPTLWPVITRPEIRVTVWAAGMTVARDAAGLCLGVLLSQPIPGVGVTNPSALLDDRDPDNGAMIAGFSVTVTARTLRA